VLAGLPATGDGHPKKLTEAARLWAGGQFIAEKDHEKQTGHVTDALAAFGLRMQEGDTVLDDVQPFYLWPENVPSWELFLACSTQWREGFSGPEGLAYEGVHHVMRAMRVRSKHWRQRWEDLQAMEFAALDHWRKQSR
jgi:hypothetical protein